MNGMKAPLARATELKCIFGGVQCRGRPTHHAMHGQWREESQVVARRCSQLGASTSYSVNAAAVDEELIVRELSKAASNASAVEAERLLNLMERNGLDVSSSEYHALIFAYAKAGKSLAAYKTLRAMRQAGIEPTAESYAVTILACMQQDLLVKAEEPRLLQNKMQVLDEEDVLDVRIEPEPLLETQTEEESVSAARRVYDWLMTAPVDRQPGWACYLQGLVQEGLSYPVSKEQVAVMEQVESHLEYGRLEGWYPDSDMYVDILQLLCADPKKAVAAEQLMWEDLVTREGVRAETEHYNCILRAEAIHSGLNMARKTLIEMMESKMGKHVRPNTATFNALIEGCIMERLRGMSYSVDDLEETVAEMITIGIKMDKRTHTLLVIFYMLQQDMDKVVFELNEANKLAAEGQVLDQLSNDWLSMLVAFLLREKCVLEVVRILLTLQSDDRPLPDELCSLDENGQTFATRWLGSYLVGQFAGRNDAELQKYNLTGDEDEDDEDYQIDDTWIGKDNVAINPDSGVPLTPKSMDLLDLKAELQAKGLSSEGNKTTLTRRIKQSRGNQPVSIKEILLRQEADIQSRKIKQEVKDSESLLGKGQRLVQRYIETIDHSVITGKYLETFVVDEDEEGDNDELDEDFENLHALKLPPEVTEQMKEYREAFNTRDLDTMYQLESEIWNTDDPDFLKLNPHFHGREGFGVKLMWPTWGTGARLALVMLDMARELGGQPSVNDYLQVNEACVQEEDDATALALLDRLAPDIHILDNSTATWFCCRTLLLCLQNDNMRSAKSVTSYMLANNFDIPEELASYFQLVLVEDAPDAEPVPA